MEKKYLKYSSWYFFMFFAYGSFFPLFSQLLTAFKLSGDTMGTIFSIGSFSMLIAQPFWGYINDKLKKPKKIIIFLLISSAIAIGLFFFTDKSFMIGVVYLIFIFFNSGLGSVSDATTISSGMNFGKVRLWGSVGYAVGVQVAGIISEYLGIESILWLYILFMFITVGIISMIKVNVASTAKINFGDIKILLKNKKFMLLSLACFFVGGAIPTNNNYFGILYKYLGGSVSGIGLAFLLFAGSEAPIMSICQKITDRINLVHGMIFVTIISALRWGLYGLTNSPEILLYTFLLQGLSVGGYLVFAIMIVTRITKPNVRTTAISIFGAITFGLGGMVLQFISGKIMGAVGIQYSYIFLFVVNILALGIFVKLNKEM